MKQVKQLRSPVVAHPFLFNRSTMQQTHLQGLIRNGAFSGLMYPVTPQKEEIVPETSGILNARKTTR
jgi:hypothetical protein